MALDAICLQAVVAEVAPQVQGLKIEKIQQPTRDQVQPETASVRQPQPAQAESYGPAAG